MCFYLFVIPHASVSMRIFVCLGNLLHILKFILVIVVIYMAETCFMLLVSDLDSTVTILYYTVDNFF